MTVATYLRIPTCAVDKWIAIGAVLRYHEGRNWNGYESSLIVFPGSAPTVNP